MCKTILGMTQSDPMSVWGLGSPFSISAPLTFLPPKSNQASIPQIERRVIVSICTVAFRDKKIELTTMMRSLSRASADSSASSFDTSSAPAVEEKESPGQDEAVREENQETEDADERDNAKDAGGENDEPPIKLYKSPRLKGYITIALASVINFNAAILSTDPIASNSVPASPTQQRYAKAVSLGSAIVTGFLTLVHLDRYSPLQPIWKKAFGRNSRIELSINFFLFLWWFVATIVQTSVRGIAGDGKEQYNLYYSTWVCCWTAMWTLERKLMEDRGWVSLRTFIKSWPYRAPGWIAIWISCLFTLFWYLDLFLNTAQDDGRIPETLRPFYQTIPQSQYQWLLFVAAITLLPSSVFIFAEIFRESNEEVKGPLENILEGFVLLLLSIGWIPSVIVATTPGGFASLVGNAYFFTWLTTVLVMETSLWFIHDFRGSIHKALEEKEQEYREHQQQVLERSRQVARAYGIPLSSSQQPHESPRHDHSGSSSDSSDGVQDTAKRLRFGNVEEEPPTFNDFEEDLDDSLERELRFKEQNKVEYFDTLNDILE